MPVLVMPVVVVVVAVVMPGFVVPVMPVFVPLLCDDLVLPPRVRNSLQVVGVFFEVGAVVVLIVVVIIKVTRVVCLLVFVAVGITAIVLLASSPRVATTSPPTAAAVSIAMMVVPAVLVPTVAKTRQQGRRANMLNRDTKRLQQRINNVSTFQCFSTRTYLLSEWVLDLDGEAAAALRVHENAVCDAGILVRSPLSCACLHENAVWLRGIFGATSLLRLELCLDDGDRDDLCERRLCECFLRLGDFEGDEALREGDFDGELVCTPSEAAPPPLPLTGLWLTKGFDVGSANAAFAAAAAAASGVTDANVCCTSSKAAFSAAVSCTSCDKLRSRARIAAICCIIISTCVSASDIALRCRTACSLLSPLLRLLLLRCAGSRPPFGALSLRGCSGAAVSGAPGGCGRSSASSKSSKSSSYSVLTSDTSSSGSTATAGTAGT